MKPDKVLSFLGIAMKAGKAISGEVGAETEIKGGRASLVIIAEDASKNTKKKFQNMCDFYKVPYYLYGTRDDIGRAIGKEYRATVAITDDGIAKGLLKHLDSQNHTIS